MELQSFPSFHFRSSRIFFFWLFSCSFFFGFFVNQPVIFYLKLNILVIGNTNFFREGVLKMAGMEPCYTAISYVDDASLKYRKLRRIHLEQN